MVLLYRRFGTTYGLNFKVKEVLFSVDFLTLEDVTEISSRNVGKGLPFDAALYPRRAQISRHLTIH
jgi:hypothetical protein